MVIVLFRVRQPAYEEKEKERRREKEQELAKAKVKSSEAATQAGRAAGQEIQVKGNETNEKEKRDAQKNPSDDQKGTEGRREVGGSTAAVAQPSNLPLKNDERRKDYPWEIGKGKLRFIDKAQCIHTALLLRGNYYPKGLGRGYAGHSI